jgi:Tol biopolymer transport system component
MIGLLIGLTFFAYFERRASQQIAFITSNGDLSTVRADGEEVINREVPDFADASFLSAQWAPDGSALASTAQENQNSSILVTTPPQHDVSLYQEEAPAGTYYQLPDDAWAPDSQHLAVALRSATNPRAVELIIADVAANDSTATGLMLNLGGGAPRWHPTENLLLTPTITDSITATLHMVHTNGTSELFAPEDEQDRRLFGDWSPNGAQIVYVGVQPSAVASTTDITRTTILVADRTGTNPRPLVSEGLNYAPFWAPRGDYIFFTRLVPNEAAGATRSIEAYEFCRVALNETEPSCFAQGTPAFLNPFIRRHTIAHWSPDLTKFFFQGYDPVDNETRLYISNIYDGSNAVMLAEEATTHLMVLWSPTNRGLLINNPEAYSMYLRWIDEERPGIELPRGRYPTWQP